MSDLKLDSEQEKSESLVPDIVEDFALSDVEEDPTSFNKKAIHIDSNNRIVGNFIPSFDGKSPSDGESCVIRYNDVDVKLSGKSRDSPSTSYEDIETSDVESDRDAALDIQVTDQNSHVFIKSDFPSETTEDMPPSNSHFYPDPIAEMSVLRNRKRPKKNLFNFYEAFAEQDKKVSHSGLGISSKAWNVSDKEMLLSDDEGSLLTTHAPLASSASQLEFIDMDSEGNSTDTEDIIFSSNTGPRNRFSKGTAEQKRSVYANTLPVKNDSSKIEHGHTDNETLSDTDEATFHRRIYKDHLLKVDRISDDENTEEEEFYDETHITKSYPRKSRPKSEWTETDESGNVKHIKIKTETSIKVGAGDDDESGNEEGVRTTTSTTRIVTTVTTDGTEGETSEELRSSMEAVLSQFMSDEPATQDSSTSQPQ